MNEFISMSPDITELAKALSKAQAEFKPVEKNCTNPYFNSKYSDLSAISAATKEALAKHGLSIVQLPTGGSGNGISLTTILLHVSGQWISGSATYYGKDPTVQAMGGCLTYGRRYGQSAALNLHTEEDDDGNGVSKPQANQTQQKLYQAVTVPLSNSSGKAYTVMFGKFKGKTLSEIPTEEIESYVRFLSTPKDGKAPSPGGLEFIAEAKRFLSGPKMDPGPAKDSTPDFDDSDIPF